MSHIVYTFFQTNTDGIITQVPDIVIQNGKSTVSSWAGPSSIYVCPIFISDYVHAFTVIMKFQNPNIKLLASIGGTEVESGILSTIASSATKRRDFSQKIAQFLVDYGFHGIDIYWQYPGFGQGDPVNDKSNFDLLLESLRTEVDLIGRTLSVTVATTSNIYETSYDIKGVADKVDYVNLDISRLRDNGDVHTATCKCLSEITFVRFYNFFHQHSTRRLSTLTRRLSTGSAWACREKRSTLEYRPTARPSLSPIRTVMS
jgi:Glycosyl hydrolases family 18